MGLDEKEVQEGGDLSVCLWASLVAQTVKHLPAVWETWIQSLGWEDPLEEGMATHSSILAWTEPSWTEELAGYSPWGCKESDMTEQLSTQHTHTYLCMYVYIHIYLWLIHVVWQKPTQLCKAIIFQLKKNQKMPLE